MFSHKIYLGNLDHSLTEEEIVGIFSEFGKIRSVKIRAGDGFGFIRYKTLEGAQRAIDSMNGKEVNGRTLKVEDARPVRHHISRFRR